MFEGLVRQLLAGYLGRYIKDIQKDQLKIGLWNEEVLLENVELILEAFEYLQLPFALTQGRVGKLSIKIPWKKLGWDPIIIVLEDVFVCACPRDDHEWSLESVERREFAGKKAKLAAAELAKLSRRVCDNQAGQSFLSYISAKILDGIQVSIRNVHVIYTDNRNVSAQLIFGIRFSSLTIMTDSRPKQNSAGSCSGKLRGGQVNKIVEILSLGIYCNTFEEASNSLDIGNADGSQLCCDPHIVIDRSDYILAPFDVTVSLVVNKSGNLENGAAHYNITAELTAMVVLLNEIQLQRILSLSDYLTICSLREKYGRYRPWHSPLSRKLDGWQRMWWRYAQQAILLDVRRKLRKTSWSNLARRISYRRKYVNLYKTKLEAIRQEQPVNEDILEELEQMEKESEIDDILSYRSVAECELQEHLLNSTSPTTICIDAPPENQQNDERSASRPRGWLNWLSLGMLGAGGTDDSSQFSGVISDEIVKDIYEATKFQPVNSSNGVTAVEQKLYFSAIHLSIHQIIATLRSKKDDRETVRVTFDGVSIECKLWEDSMTILSLINSVEMVDVCTENVILVTRKAVLEESSSKLGRPFISTEIKMSPLNHDLELSIKVVLEPFAVTYDSNFLLDLLDFYHVLRSIQFHHERVFLSLNGFEDFKVRLLSKAEYIFSNRMKITWDICLSNFTVKLPWRDEHSELLVMVHAIISSLSVHFSKSIYDKLLTLNAFLDISTNERKLFGRGKFAPHNIGTENANGSSVFQYSVAVNLEHVSLHVNLENDSENSLILAFTLGKIGIQYGMQELVEEYCLFVRTLEVSTCSLGAELGGHVLCSSRKSPAISSTHQYGETFEISIISETCDEKSASVEGSFLLHHQARRSIHRVCHEYTVGLNDIDLHFYPRVFGLLLEFYDRISGHDSSDGPVDVSFVSNQEIKDQNMILEVELQRYGFSNYYETGSTSMASIPLDRFPFVTICNSDSLDRLDKSLVHGTSDWRRIFHVRDRCSVGSQKFSTRKKSKKFNLSSVKPIPGMDVSTICQSSNDTNTFVVDLNLNGIRAHLHDSSCILGTITLPVSNSSIFIHGSDCWDMLCSVEGLILSSPWSTPNVHDFVCGPALSNIFPILNIRVKKREGEALLPQVEICIGIQHVCCILSTEFLAMMIGYFSLPDWNLNGNEKHVTVNDEHGNISSKDIDLICKFEILDSTLILPLESNTHHSLRLGLQQLYCSFTPMSNSGNTLKDIPPECVIPTYKVVDRAHIVNVFGRGISLSLMLLKDDGQCLLKVDQDTGIRNIPLIASLDADLWIRIPCEAKCSGGESDIPTYFMIRVDICQFIAEEDYFLCGLEAVACIINQLSTVGRESQGFTSDVLQFMQFKRNLKEKNTAFLDDSSETFTEARCSINSLSIELRRSRRRNYMSSELVAKADMQLKFTASLRNEIPICTDVDISGLVLYSFRISSILLEFPSVNSTSSCLSFHFSKSARGENEFLLTIPSLDIWLHLSDWGEFIELLGSCSRSSSMIASKGSNSGIESQRNPECQKTFSVFPSENFTQTSVLIVKSEKISISFHLPVWVEEEALDKSREAKVKQEMPQKPTFSKIGEKTMLFEAKHGKYVAFGLRSRYSELVIDGRSARLKSNIDKTRGMLEVIEKQTVSSFPFFQISQINVEGEVCEKQESMHVSAELRLETVDVWLSHQIFFFWRGIAFKIPEAAPSQVPFYSMVVQVHLRRASLLLNDGRWSSNGPIVEILQRNLLADFNQTASSTEVSVAGDLQVNYNNIHKVMWEPFMEPWKFQFNMVRKHEQNALLNLYVVTDIHLKSTAQLNLNVTEPLIEAIFRGTEMIKDAWSQIGVHHPPGSQGTLGSLASENVSRRRYAPYILQNDTSMPLLFWVSCGPASVDDTDIMAMKEGNIVQPGSSVPIYIDETPEEQIFPHRPSNSSERLNEKKSSGMAHHMISVQLDGTSRPSIPMSMDLVGLSYFEVDFSKPSYTIEIEKDDDASRYIRKTKERYGANPKSGFVVPVVFEVSMQRYSKLIRLHSTVILFNATSMPLELRFDIPFGVSPKVLDPIYPGQEFPLPVHLAEAGRMRWRPLGTNYLWSEAHPLSNILLQENRLGFLRSFVCYPSHPSSDPFRCCISIQDISLVSSTSGRQSAKKSSQMQNPDKRLMHIVRLTTPLLVKSYIPKQLSLRIESGGITHSTFLSEVDTAAVFHIDSTHDLGIMFHMEGFKPTISKFPRAETFTTMAKLSESKFSLCETLTFYPDVSNGPICVTVEKVMDAFCGARELCISIPFLLYNCTGLPLTISDCGNENKGSAYPIPSCYNLVGLEKLLARKQGLALVSFDQDSSSTLPNFKKIVNLSSKKHTISLRENSSLHSHGFLKNQIPSYNSSTHFCGDLENHDLTFGKAPFRSSMNGGSSGSQSNLSEKVGNGLSSLENEESRKARAFMYSPCNFPASELMVRLSTYLSEHESQNIPSSMWSSSFFLVQPGGSTSVIIPQPRTAGAFIISITSSLVAGALAGKTRAITFQPRYVISNACSKELCYKQKGTNISSCLGVGQHSHLHWTDTTRELLVCLRFNEPGWQWSGSFLPDHLGDAQVKMHNYVSGASNMVRVEVQNADVSVKDEKIVGSSSGNSGTYLILLSDDNSGFMPYRIDNFSMERLRIYQQKCERFETTVHPYTCRPYAWDEPCYPHRLVLEVPGERVIGSYSLDDVREHIPVYLSSTSEKPERRLFLSIRAEGATKVLSIIDSNYHILKDVKESVFPGFKEKKKLDQRTETHVDFSERVTVHVSFIGISLIDSSPQELVYICARDTQIDVLQSLDRQKISFQMSLLQIDNQLRNTPYPVILSFDEKLKSESVGHTACKSTCEPIFCLAAAKWRNKESSLVSFEYVNIRLAPLRIELEEQVLLSLLNFVRTVTLRLQSGSLQSEMQTMDGMGAVKERLAYGHDYDPMRKSNSGRLHSLKVFKFSENNKSSPSLPTVVPIGAPWQQIFLLARRQKKIYVEIFDLAPIKLTVSFSSTPWMLRNEGRMAAESLVHVGSTAVQRGLMALVDVEGAPVYLKQLTITHHLASWESIQEILIKHYTRQLLHEMYKVFGSAGVIGNPMGFARNVGLGLKDFLSVPAKGVLQSPTGLITGMAQGTKSLLSNTVYAVSNAATQFSKAAHKGILAFTFDEQTVSKMKKRQDGLDSHSKGVLNEFLEGLTGLLQSPIRGAEKHGLPGVLSGIALGTAGVVARPIASILEVTGKTAQSIRNRSSPHQSNRFRIRFPRPLARDVPLLPYCWEEAIGTLMLLEADDSKLKDEICIMCKALKQPGKFVIITERVVLVFQCSSLVGFGSPEFAGVSDPQWVIEAQLGLEGVVHIDREEEVVNVVGGCIETLSRPQQLKRSSQRIRWLGPTTSVPLIQMSIELSSQEDAEDVSQALRSTIERGKEQCWGVRVLHRSNLRVK
ncbi:uncharacterized protein LOC131248653 isoform X2 [Magnolia sinica]|uniref:uncharacterized protein LOC131248653 isoform X2 n=1 Tax=Magnolia sinica TaxID=86752 RepID=UPI00265B098A|nr:uncharacterized protein LOC131248653 isoform X2 [Magnolia sinica]